MKTYFPGDPGHLEAVKQIHIDLFVFQYRMAERLSRFSLAITASSLKLQTKTNEWVVIGYPRLLTLLTDNYCFTRPFVIHSYQRAQEYMPIPCTFDDNPMLGEILFIHNVPALVPKGSNLSMKDAIETIEKKYPHLFENQNKHLQTIYTLVEQELKEKKQEEDKSE